MIKDRVLYTVTIQVWEGGNDGKYHEPINLINRRFEHRNWAIDYYHYLQKLAHKFLPTFKLMVTYAADGAIREVLGKKFSKEKLTSLEIKAIYELCRSEYNLIYPGNMICQVVANPIFVPTIIYGWKRINKLS